MNGVPDLLVRRLPFFYGYIVAGLAVLTTICSSPGQTFAISAFTPYFQESLGLSSSSLAAAYMLGTFLAAFPLAIVGPISDRYGIRITSTVVAVGLALSCWWISRASGFYTLFAGFLLLRFLGQGALSLLASNMVSMWFHNKLGRVNAVMSVGGTLAFGIVPIALVSGIASFGWRASFVTMGIAVAVTLIPALLLFLKNRPEDLGLLPDGLRSERTFFEIADSSDSNSHADSPSKSAHGVRDLTLAEATSHRSFWIMTTAMVTWALIGTGIVFYAYPIFEQFGIEASRAKLLFTTFSASMLVGQVAGGILADRMPVHKLLAGGYTSLLIGSAIIPCTTSAWYMHAFALFFGMGQGIALAASSTMWVRYYGRKHLGKIRGAIWCCTVAGSGCGPFVLGVLHDATGSYTLGLWLFALAFVPQIPLLLMATSPQGPPPPEDDADMSRFDASVAETQSGPALAETAG